MSIFDFLGGVLFGVGGGGELGLVSYVFNILGSVPAAPCPGSTMPLLRGGTAAAAATLLCTALIGVCSHHRALLFFASLVTVLLLPAFLPPFIFFSIVFFPSRVARKLRRRLAFTNLHLVICCTGLWELRGGGRMGGEPQNQQQQKKRNKLL